VADLDQIGPDAQPLPGRTPEELARYVVAQVAPEQTAALDTVAAAYFEVPAVRRRILKTVWGRRHLPPTTGLDPGTGGLIVQALLVVFVGIGTNLVSGTLPGRWRAFRRWRIQRRMRRLDARQARAAVVRTYAEQEIDGICETVADVMRHARVPEAQVQQVLTVLRYVLAARG